MSYLEFFLLLCGGIFLSVTGYSFLMIVAFLIIAIYDFYKYVKEGDYFRLLKIIIFALIIPNSYVINVVLIVFAIIKFRREKISKRGVILTLIACILLGISSFINYVPLLNFVLSLWYYLPIVLSFYIFWKERGRLKRHFDNIVAVLRWVMWIQIMGVVSYAVIHIDTISEMIDMDWVTGTFGMYQGNIFFFFMIFSAIVFYRAFSKTREKRYIFYVFASLALAIATGSIALIIIAAVSSVVYFLFVKKKKTVREIAGASIMAALLVAVFVLVTPNWIMSHIKNLFTDYGYFSSYVQKMHTYKNTFVDIPNDDLKFLIIGNGAGMFSSRAALTATGIYIPVYSRLFEPSMSEYTRTYIYPRLQRVMTNHLGVLDTPYSSIISIQGEFGLIGMILTAVLAFYLLKSSRSEAFIFSLVFVLGCFVDNYMEFPKVVAMLAILVCLFNGMQPSKKKKEATLIVSSSSIGYGADKSMVQTAKMLKKNDQNPIVVLPSSGRTCDFLDEAKIPYLIVPFKNWMHFDLSFVGKYIKPILKLAVNFFLSVKLYLRLRSQYKIRLVYSNSFTNYFSIWVSKMFGVPHIQHIREFGDLDFGWNFDFGRERTIEYATKNSEKLICISEAVRDNFVKFSDPEKLLVVYNGLPEVKNVEHNYEESPVGIVMTGRLSPEKKQAVLLKAIEKIEGKNEIFVHIYGDGVDFEGLQRYVDNHDLGEVVKLMGYSDKIDFSKYLIGVICSKAEGFGRVTVEYMMHGLCAIGADSGATPEIIRDRESGLLYHGDDGAALARCIENVVRDRDSLKRLAKKGHELATEVFSEKMYLANMKSILVGGKQ